MIDGERLRWWRQRRLLTLRGLSERTGVAYDTIHAIETGKQRPRPGTVRKLAEALGVEPEQLMPEEPETGKAAA